MTEDRRPDRQAAEHGPLLILKDESGIIRQVDEATTRVLGWRPEDMIGHRSLEFIHPDDHDSAMGSWVRILVEPGSPARLRLRHSDAAGHWVSFDVTNHNLLNDPAVRAVRTEMVAVADEPDDQETTWVSNQLLRRLTEALPLGVLQIDRGRRIVFGNARLDVVVGRPLARTVDEQFAAVQPDDRSALAAALDAVLAGDDVDVEVGLTHPESGVRRCAVLLRALTDRLGQEVTGALLCVSDVTEQARTREEMKRRAEYDGLTHCLNRASVLRSLGEALAAARQRADGSGVAVVFVDVDRFKAVNDRYGHAVGDRLLRTIAERLRAVARTSDAIGRLGGDEFLLVCPDVECEQAALALGERAGASIGQPADLDGVTLVPSASIGVAWSRGDTGDGPDLVARADEAMYRAKRRHPRPDLRAG
jgi:diguanylate cyclase (GGDEF)-like protein/PAS domain S-box-containing protein